MNRLLVVLVLVLAASPASASEVEGVLSTGAGAVGGITLTVDPHVSGTVVTLGVPTASPVAGTYTSAQSVALSAPSDATSIRYVLLDTDAAPTCTTGAVYSSPIAISSTTGIRAVACYAGGLVSSVASFAYIINPPSAPAPSGGGGSGGGGGGGFVATAPLRGDVTNDGKVNFFDFSALLVDWGKTDPFTFTNSRSDLNGDGKVDFTDFTLLLVNWSA